MECRLGVHSGHPIAPPHTVQHPHQSGLRGSGCRARRGVKRSRITFSSRVRAGPGHMPKPSDEMGSPPGPVGINGAPWRPQASIPAPFPGAPPISQRLHDHRSGEASGQCLHRPPVRFTVGSHALTDREDSVQGTSIKLVAVHTSIQTRSCRSQTHSRQPRLAGPQSAVRGYPVVRLTREFSRGSHDDVRSVVRGARATTM